MTMRRRRATWSRARERERVTGACIFRLGACRVGGETSGGGAFRRDVCFLHERSRGVLATDARVPLPNFTHVWMPPARRGTKGGVGVDGASEIRRRRGGGFGERDAPRGGGTEFVVNRAVDSREVVRDGGVERGALNVRLFAE